MSPEDLRHSSEAPLLEINNKLDEFENNLNDLNTQKSQQISTPDKARPKQIQKSKPDQNSKPE